MKRSYYLTFHYDKYGYGDLCMYEVNDDTNDNRLMHKYRSRTGSIDPSGQLVNKIKPGRWTGREASRETHEAGMTITPGEGWKWRLWNSKGGWSHYLIHPDGNKPGTKGCIGIQNDDALDLKEDLTIAVNSMEQVPVFIVHEGEGMGKLREFLREKVAERREEFKKKAADLGATVTDETTTELIEAAKKVVEYDEKVANNKGIESAKGTGVAVLVSSIVLGILGSLGVEVGANLETGVTAGVSMAVMAIIAYVKKRRDNQKKVLRAVDR